MDFFAFVIGWHVAATRMAVHEYILSLPIVKWSTALSVKHHTKIQFFSSSGHTIARKCFLKTGEKKEYMLHYCFQEFIFIVASPEITGNQLKSYNVRA